MGRRTICSTASLAIAVFALSVAFPATVAAHPLGNYTINHFAEITVAPREVRLDVVIDLAEIPAFQERQRLDVDGDGEVSDLETLQAAHPACASVQALMDVSVDGNAISVEQSSAEITFWPGLGGLSTMRVECSYSAQLPASITAQTSISFKDGSYPERIGWREIIAHGDGVEIDSNGLPEKSPSKRLTDYPMGLNARPLEIQSATIVATPSAAPVASTAPGAAVQPPPPPLNSAGAPGAVPGGIAGGDVPTIFREVDLTPLVLLLSLATAFALGAGHALTPGHGKTMMAAYLVGSRGQPIHAVGLGLSVTVSHTLGILVIAAVVVGAQGVLAPDVVVRTAPAIASVTITALGGWMLVSEIRKRLAARRAAAAHAHAHERDLPHEHENAYPAEGAQAQAHAHGVPPSGVHQAPQAAANEAAHAHAHAQADPDHNGANAHVPAGTHSHGGVSHSHMPAAGSRLSWRGLFALGLAGGLIPSTSALFILLGSIVAGRPAFGFLLVVVFGLGMAVVMTTIGLVMVFARGRLDRLPSSTSIGRAARQLPLLAAVVVLGFGLFLSIQAIAGPPVL